VYLVNNGYRALRSSSSDRLPSAKTLLLSSATTAADGESLLVGVFSSTLSFGRLVTWAFLKVGLDGTITTLVENGDVRFSYAIPSPDGRRLALAGSKVDSSNVWLLENF
jgi:hypothetical protein